MNFNFFVNAIFNSRDFNKNSRKNPEKISEKHPAFKDKSGDIIKVVIVR